MTETSIWDKISTESCRLMRGAPIPQRIPSRAPHRTNSRLRRHRPLQRIKGAFVREARWYRGNYRP